MPISSRRCGMITKREAERLCKSFLGDNAPPKLPDNFAFEVSYRPHTRVKIAKNMKSVSWSKLPYFEEIFKF